MERWRRPLKILSIEPHDTEMIVLPDGRVQRANVVRFDRESTERIRAGYACAKCLEVFEVPWPILCTTCGAPIRARQAEYFEKEFALQEPVKRPSWEEEAAGVRERLEEQKERERRERL